ncbi:hypothetical protein F0562_004109 [Nyssa sinensis]|uniref:Uncharacterized protein n=1 Tax=Nyssa sinensis TaxID=561372 RepID=A0A5J5C0I4_9ASTE|nr:hypothetical protein F0562_004109 [Nyssa sinensis]
MQAGGEGRPHAPWSCLQTLLKWKGRKRIFGGTNDYNTALVLLSLFNLIYQNSELNSYFFFGFPDVSGISLRSVST